MEEERFADSPAQVNNTTIVPIGNSSVSRKDKVTDDVTIISSTSGSLAAQAIIPVTNSSSVRQQQQKSKYSQLLAIIEELGKDIRPTYAGSRSSAERLKRGIVYARILVRECLMETERNGCKVHTITEFKTAYNADCIEWCPKPEYADHFVYGTYQLEENELHEQKWLGNVVLSRLSLGEDGTSGLVEKKSDIQINGVFDVKWSPWYINDKCLLAVASCDGFIQLIQVNLECSEKLMVKICSSDVSEKQSGKPLSVDWNPGIQGSLVVSDSSGRSSYLSLSSSDLQIEKTWKAHNFEAWTSSFDCAQPYIIYSGGDDCLMKAWDLRTDLQSPVFQSQRHNMGVTTVTKSKKKEYLLASGSYDEHIFLWDLRNTKNPISDEHISGGGVWKLKWHPTLPNYLLSAAMHKGFHVVHVDETDSIKREVSYEKHTSLAYGVDWCYKGDWSKNTKAHNNHIVASCSFYDNLVHIWQMILKYD